MARRALVVALLAALAAGCSGAPAPTAPAVPTARAERPAGSLGAAATSGPAAGRRPLVARVHYRFPVAGCRVSYAHVHHDYPATDIMAPRGCRFVAPVDGRVDEVSRADRWDPSSNRGADRGGRSVSLVGVDGVRYYGSHL